MSAQQGPQVGSPPSLAHALPPGLKLRDCLIRRVLGEGGFGIVYLADDLNLARDVAVKEYLPAAIASRSGDGRSVVLKGSDNAEAFSHGLKSFLNEARLLGRFDHPALVKVYRYWEDNGTGYMAMPYYEGPTLRRRHAPGGAPPAEADIRAWLMPLLDALETIHRDNCYHRDIAPDNILLTKQGPVLLDFGAARRVIGDLTHTLTAVLKPGYAPIEQYGSTEDFKQGPWTDLYALASVLYWVITREKPPASIDRIVVDRLKPLSTRAAGVYRPAFLAAIDQALAVLPEYRPQSVAQFRALLDSEVAASAGMPRTPSLLRPTSPQAFGAASLSATPNNLPRQRTSFVGREAESAEVKALLDASALVTVLGMGGMGKTRLTLQVASELLPRYAGGVWFVDLSAVQDADLVVPAFARAFGLLEEPGRPLIDTVCAWLKPRPALLVVDNCEHLVQVVAETVDTLLGRAPLVQVLASSRESLDVPGEQAYPLRPLPLPERDADAGALLQSDAVRMFADRARAHRPQFQVDPAEAGALGQLLHRLEGIPLAIELAAARLRTMSVAEIAAGLDDRYRLLEGGSRLLQPRQQTLRALVDWSWDLLSEDERRVFAALAAFAGGFDGDAVRAVCTDEATPPEQVDAHVSALVQKSLVLREDEGDGQRLRLLETLRDYAREKLAAAGSADAVAVRHCAHFFALAKEGARGIHGPEQGRWVRRLDVELENLRAAIACALAGRADPVIAVKLAVALTGFWLLRGHASEGRRVVDQALALPVVQATPMAQAWALYTGAVLASSQGDHETAVRELEACLQLRRTLGAPVEIAATLSTLALTLLQAGDDRRAAECETEALSLFAAAGDLRGQAIGRVHLAQIRLWSGQMAAAKGDLMSALTFARAVANQEVEAACELTTAEMHLREGRPSQAEDAVLRSLEICRAAGDKRGEAQAEWWLGRIALLEGELALAHARLQRAMAEFQAHDMRTQLLGCLEDLCRHMAESRQPGTACAMAAAAAQARLRWKLKRSPWDQERWQALQQLIASALPPDEAERAARTGREWELEDVLKAALGDPEQATVLFGTAA